MNKQDVQAYFDCCAPTWDERLLHPQKAIDAALDAAGVCAGVKVLDVACGTGVLFEDYMMRHVQFVTGVDLSSKMTCIARRKFPQSRIEVICADIEETDLPRMYDCCVVYNALPHFVNPARLVERLSRHVVPGGRLCVAHSMSRSALIRHHMGPAERVSREIPEAVMLGKLMAPNFKCDTAISNESMYIVAGVRI